MAAYPRPPRHLTALALAAAGMPCWLWPAASMAGPPSPPNKPGQGDVYDEQEKTAYDEQEEEERRAEARKLFTRGVAEQNQGKWEDSWASLSQAWKRMQHWQVAYFLAKAEVRTGRFRAAIEHFGVTLASDDRDARPIRSECLDLREQARAGLARIRVAGAPAGAEVRIDGEVRGVLPLDGPLEVDPGTREVVLVLGKRTATQRVVVTSGQIGEAKLDVSPPAPPKPLLPTPPPPSRIPLILGLSGAGAGAIAFIAGTALWTESVHHQEAANHVQGASPAIRDALFREAIDRAQTEAAGAVAMWLIGGACLVGGVGYWAYSDLTRPPAGPVTVSIVPVLSPDRAGLAATGAW